MTDPLPQALMDLAKRLRAGDAAAVRAELAGWLHHAQQVYGDEVRLRLLAIDHRATYAPLRASTDLRVEALWLCRELHRQRLPYPGTLA